FFFFVLSVDLLFRHSFPTRRSSDLNMGVVLGPSRVCSLDVDHVEYCRQVFSDVLGINLDDLAAANPTLVGNPARFRIMFRLPEGDRKSTRLNSSHVKSSYAVFCLKK